MAPHRDSPEYGTHSSEHSSSHSASPANGRRLFATMSESMRFTSPGVSSDIEGASSPLLAPISHVEPPPPSPGTLWEQFVNQLGFGAPRAPPPPSGLYTILPMSDARLRPQRTILLMGVLSALALGIVVGVFLLVPRGVTVGEVTFTPRDWHRNATEQSYQLTLDLEIPVINPNFYQARIEGELHVMFYSQVAGKATLGRQIVSPRSHNQVLNITVDASNVPERYSMTVLAMCQLYPRKLIFFFKAKLTATSLLQREALPTINTYFFVDCTNTASPLQPFAEPPPASYLLDAVPEPVFT